MANISSIKGKRGTTYRVRVRREGFVVSESFLIRGEAERWARATEVAIDNGTYAAPDESSTMTLGEALEKYRLEFTCRKAWPEVEGARIKRLKKHPIAALAIGKVDSSDISDYVKNRHDDGKGNNTIRLELAVLSQVFKQARIAWKMTRLGNPVNEIDRPKAPKGKRRRFEAGELENLCKHLQPDVALMLRIAIATALRRSELVRVTWSDLDLKGGWLHNIKGKDGMTESIPLSSTAVQLFQSVQKVAGSNQVFQRTAGYLSTTVSKVAHALGLKGVSFHTTRHEATSRLFERGLRIEQVQTVTRHKTLQMVALYNHARLEDTKAMLEKTEGDSDKSGLI